MFDFFFYGTLVDADVRRLVLGREIPDEALHPASLVGFRRYTVREQPYPAAVPRPGSSIDGVVFPRANLRDAAMLTCFEGTDYAVQLCRVASAADVAQDAWVFVATKRVPRGKPHWSIDEWRTRHKPAFVEIASKWLNGISDADISAAEQIWRARLDG